jgi:hypothetical protein
MFPYKVTNAGVVRMCLIRGVGLFMSHQQAFDRHIVEKGDGNVGYLVL